MSSEAPQYTPGTWIVPICDRTQTDVTKRTSKAYINFWDLIRLEQDTKYLADLLNAYGYNQTLNFKLDWARGEVSYLEQMERIRSNIEVLLNVFHTTPIDLPTSLAAATWQKLNAVEENLKILKDYTDAAEKGFRYSGSFNCGQELVLP